MRARAPCALQPPRFLFYVVLRTRTQPAKRLRCTRPFLSVAATFVSAISKVFRDKSAKEIASFGMLVSSTLKDVVALGSGVDPVLRSKLMDMTDDIEAVGRDVEERQRDKQERETEQA